MAAFDLALDRCGMKCVAQVGMTMRGIAAKYGISKSRVHQIIRSDDWTAFDDEGKPISDSARYRMLGNAVCVNVAEWIGRRIMAKHKKRRNRGKK